eukprot:11685562-Heterocapsa_arctica.AAC.1
MAPDEFERCRPTLQSLTSLGRQADSGRALDSEASDNPPMRRLRESQGCRGSMPAESDFARLRR